jgi:hypothetical protein
MILLTRAIWLIVLMLAIPLALLLLPVVVAVGAATLPLWRPENDR